MEVFTSIMRSALMKLREGRGEGIIAADETLELGKENQKEGESCLFQLLDPFSNKLKRSSCFEVPQPKRKRSLPLEDDLLEEKMKRRDRCPSEESNNSIDAELNRHFRPIKKAPVSPPKKNEEGRMVRPTLVRLRPRGRPAKVQFSKTPCIETANRAPENLSNSEDSLQSDNLDGKSVTVEIIDKVPSTCVASTSSIARPTSVRTTLTRSSSASPVVSSASLKCREELAPSAPRLLETPNNYTSKETCLSATSAVC